MRVLNEATVPAHHDEPCALTLADTDHGYHLDATADVMSDLPGRLQPLLRQVAKAADPLDALAQSALHFFLVAKPGHAPLLLPFPFLPPTVHTARALADLAVTGSRAWAAFARKPPDDATIKALLRAKLKNDKSAADIDVDSFVKDALDRAYSVAWALRGSVETRRSMRPGLGYIAVSGEDDPPHRPVNIPTLDHPQFDLAFKHQGIDLRIRYMIASSSREPQKESINLRQVPGDYAPIIPFKDQVILFVHGHSSRLEECGDMLEPLLHIGAAKDRSYTVIAMDQPNCGYSSMFADTKVAGANASKYPDGFPILEFLASFVEAFVEALGAQPGCTVVKEQVAAVIGGSLGGNLGLWLASKGHGPQTPEQAHARDWIRNVVSWSPASVWDPLVYDLFKDPVAGVPHGHMTEVESDGSRGDYFNTTFQGFFQMVPFAVPVPIAGAPTLVWPVIPVPAQANSWYRDDWQPCKQIYICRAMLDRFEIYNEHFRRWHWRVAYEQLIFSHRDKVSSHSDLRRYEFIAKRLLLVTGEKDMDKFLEIYSATIDLAKKMESTPGWCLPIKNTGHSIHAERPRFLASAILHFLPDRVMETPKTFRKLTHDPKTGMLWAITGGGSVVRLDSAGTWHKHSAHGDPRDIAVFNGTVYVVSHDRVHIDNGKELAELFDPFGGAVSIAVSNTGKLWQVGVQQGIWFQPLIGLWSRFSGDWTTLHDIAVFDDQPRYIDDKGKIRHIIMYSDPAPLVPVDIPIPGPGHFVRIAWDATSSKNGLWAVGAKKGVWQFKDGDWVEHPGIKAVDLSVHGGVPFVIGENRSAYRGPTWTALPEPA